MGRKGLIGALCALALCAGCGRYPRIGELSKSSVVVAFGDSLTYGTGAGKTESYPALLSEMIRCRVVNAGVPREDTSSALRRLPDVLLREKANLVIICHGGNDMLRKADQSVTRRNLDAMISLARDAGADVILIGVPKPALRLRAPPFYRELAEEHSIPLDDSTVPRILSTPSLRSDHAHPNAAGYRRMAESIADLIRRSEGV
jgi:lysophospholipase L1-like esterase